MSANGSTAICMCAAHSLDEVKRIARREDAPTTTWLPPDLKTSDPQYIEADRLHVLFRDQKGGFHVCRVDQVCYVGGNDLALLTIVAPNEAGPIFQDRLALDFRVPPPGTEIGILTNTVELENVADQFGTLALDFHMRYGRVTELRFGQTMAEQSHVFTTTVPVLGGMSGSPVFLKPQQGETAVVCGVVSSDLSDPASFGTFLEPGHSTCSMLWPSVALEVIAGPDPGNQRPYSLLELVQLGVVDSRTKGASVTVSELEDKILVEYRDEDGNHAGCLNPRIVR